LINHSCAPNCCAEVMRDGIWIVAHSDIPAGIELTFDYGFSLAEGRLHPCRCGAPRCAGFIVNAAQRCRTPKSASARKKRLHSQ
jgi:SET domain-containing protein